MHGAVTLMTLACWLLNGLLASAQSFTDDATFTFNTTVTSNTDQATMEYNPQKTLDGTKDGCTGNAFKTECEGYWWKEGKIYDTFGGGIGPSARFQFQGKSVEVFGAKFDYGAQGFYSLDDGPNTMFSAYTTNPVPTTGSLFKIEDLDPAKKHSLVIRYDSASYGPGEKRRWLSIEYINWVVPPLRVTPVNTVDKVPSFTSVAGSSVSGLSQSSNSGVLPTAESATTETPVQSQQSSNSTNAGIIAGATIGSLAIVGIALLVAFLYIRRTRQNNGTRALGSQDGHGGGTPFPHSIRSVPRSTTFSLRGPSLDSPVMSQINQPSPEIMVTSPFEAVASPLPSPEEAEVSAAELNVLSTRQARGRDELVLSYVGTTDPPLYHV